MEIEILGSGGAVPMPRAGCHCRICDEERENGVPYARGGPATFVHGANILIDTPEEIREELNRSRIDRVDACFYIPLASGSRYGAAHFRVTQPG